MALVCALGASAAHARPGLSLDMRATQVRIDGVDGTSRGVEAQLRLNRRFAIQAGYAPFSAPMSLADPANAPAPPDVRGGIVITPVPNRYFAPFLYLGGGKARYAGNRVSLLGGVGVDVQPRWWLGFVAQWTIVAPEPFEVASEVSQQRRALAASGESQPPIGSMFKQFYGLRTTEVSIGYRLVY